MIRRLLHRALCAIGDHSWTCKAEQGIPPSPERMAADPVGYFSEYSRGYCLHCGEQMEERRPDPSLGDVLVILLVLAAAGWILTRNPTAVQVVDEWPATVPASELYYGAPADTSVIARLCCRVLPGGDR